MIALRVDEPSGVANACNVMRATRTVSFLHSWMPMICGPERSSLAEFFETDALPWDRNFVNDSEIVPAGFARSEHESRRDVDASRRSAIGPFDTSFSLGENIDWLSRARQLGVDLITTMPSPRRRVHGGNTTTRSASDRSDYLKVIRAHRARLEGS